MNSTRILTAISAAALLLTLSSIGIAKQEIVGAANNRSEIPSGKYLLTVGTLNPAITASNMPLLDPELVQIGSRTFVTGTICDVASAARRSEFTGQKAFVAFGAIICMQRYPDKE